MLRKVWRVKSRNAWKTPEGEWCTFGDAEQKSFNRWLTAQVASVLGPADTVVPDEFDWCKQLGQWIVFGRPDASKSDLTEATKHLSQQQVKSIGAWISKNSAFVPLLGSGENTRPDDQQLLTDVHLVIWLDSSGESDQQNTLETRVQRALCPTTRGEIDRFGGLALGESTHVVDVVSPLANCQDRLSELGDFQLFQVHEQGRLTLPVWVDHVGSAGTRYATGNLEKSGLAPPAFERMPVIVP